MTHIFGFERSQLLLLPEAIDDYVVADNPVRFIDALVGGLDLAAAGFKRVTPKVDGTRIKAVNNKDRNFTKNSLAKFIKAVDKHLDEFATRDSPRTRR
jgi:transposase